MFIDERRGPSLSNYYKPMIESVIRSMKEGFNQGFDRLLNQVLNKGFDRLLTKNSITGLTCWPVINTLSWMAFLFYPSSSTFYCFLNSLTIVLALAEIIKTYRDQDLPIYYFATLLFWVCRRINKSEFIFHFLLRASITEFLLFPDVYFIWGSYSVMPIVLAHLLILV